MKVSIERGNKKLSFGRGMILARMEAEPLTYDGDFPALSKEERIPQKRHIELEGYMIAGAASPSGRARENEHRRRLLAELMSGENFLIRVGDKYASCTDGELIFKREAPFSGDDSERFILRAVIEGGYFHTSAKRIPVARTSDGASLPGYIDGGIAVGVYNGGCVVDTDNGGDVSVGFTGEFYPGAALSRFSLVNTATNQHISCNYDFKVGDRINISTVRDSLRFTVTRNGAETNLTGYAEENSELFLLPPKRCVLTVGDGVLFTGNVTYTDSYITF